MLADERHFGRAAHRLGISQPAVSQQLNRLEAQLGVRLVERGRARVALTDAGRAALASARTAVRAADAAEAAARAHATGLRGQLRLGISPGAHYVAQRLLVEFADTHPEVRVRAQQDSTGVLADLVARGRLELALGFCPQHVDGISSQPLWEERAVLAVGSDHRLATRSAVALADLQDETFALVDAQDGRGYNEAVVSHCRLAGFEPRVPPRPAGPMAWETAVRRDGCVGLTTRLSAVSTARGVVLLALDPPVTFPLALLRGPVDGPAARAFAALAVRGHTAGR